MPLCIPVWLSSLLCGAEEEEEEEEAELTEDEELQKIMNDKTCIAVSNLPMATTLCCVNEAVQKNTPKGTAIRTSSLQPYQPPGMSHRASTSMRATETV